MNQDNEQDLIAQFKQRIGGQKTNVNTNTKYQYPYVELETVMANPSEYIIPACLPACRELWDKNIETFMVSNFEDNHLYVLLTNVSNENKAIFSQLQKQDPRFIFDGYRNAIGIAVNGTDESAMSELKALTEVFRIQDTLRFQTAEDFLEAYKYTDGKMTIEADGTIRREKNPNLENTTLQEALEKTGKSHLYVAEEGRVYESTTYLRWHKRYEQAKEDEIKNQLSMLGSNKENMGGEIAHLRDTFLSAERNYVAELLKDEEMQKMVADVNQQPSELLFEAAKNLVDKVENGLVPDEQMGRTELQLFVLLASIQDRVLSKDLVLTPSVEDMQLVGGRFK